MLNSKHIFQEVFWTCFKLDQLPNANQLFWYSSQFRIHVFWHKKFHISNNSTSTILYQYPFCPHKDFFCLYFYCSFLSMSVYICWLVHDHVHTSVHVCEKASNFHKFLRSFFHCLFHSTYIKPNWSTKKRLLIKQALNFIFNQKPCQMSASKSQNTHLNHNHMNCDVSKIRITILVPGFLVKASMSWY